MDDEPHIRSVLGRSFERAGYRVELAHDGQEGLELAIELGPDLILTDFQMPVVSGLETAIALGQHAATAGTPIIMLTARGHMVPDEDLGRTNIKEMIQKPFGAKEVIRIAERLLGRVIERGAAA